METVGRAYVHGLNTEEPLQKYDTVLLMKHTDVSKTIGRTQYFLGKYLCSF